MTKRLMGIDHGEVRTGLAVSDELGFMAHPLETVPTERAVARIAQVVKDKQIASIVLGLPLRSDGTEGPAAIRVRGFYALLRPAVPSGVEIVLRDEARTTVDAHSLLRASGKKTKTHRPLIDQVAAVLILQEYLDQLAGTNGLLTEPPESHR